MATELQQSTSGHYPSTNRNGDGEDLYLCRHRDAVRCINMERLPPSIQIRYHGLSHQVALSQKVVARHELVFSKHLL